MSKKNILFIEESLDPTTGGVQRVTWAISNFLKKHGYNVFFLYCRIDYSIIEANDKLKLDFWTNDLDFFSQSLDHFIIQNNISIVIDQDYHTSAIQKALKEQIAKHKINLIYCYHRNPYFIDFISGSNPFFSIIKSWIKRFLGRTYRPEFAMMCEISDKYVLLSKSYINQFYRRFLVDKTKLTYILNPKPFNDIIPEKSILKKEKIVFIVTRFEERIKNIKGALDIWKEVEKKGNRGWKLIIGGYGPDELEIRRYAIDLGLEFCEIIGKIDNPSDYYKKASIYMMTSKCEGYPMTLIEAMHYGCIPIAFDYFSSVHDIIENGINGIIVKKRKPNSYVKKLFSIMNDTEKRNTLSLNAMNSTKKNDINVIGKDWISLIESFH